MTNGHLKYSFEDRAKIVKLISDKRAKAKNPKELRGIYPWAVREYFPELKKAKYSSEKFQAGLAFAKRHYGLSLKPKTDAPPVKKLKSTFRMPGKSGPKVQLPELRDALYEWVVDIRSALKGRLPMPMLTAKAHLIQEELIAEDPELANKYKEVITSKFKKKTI